MVRRIRCRISQPIKKLLLVEVLLDMEYAVINIENGNKNSS